MRVVFSDESIIKCGKGENRDIALVKGIEKL